MESDGRVSVTLLIQKIITLLIDKIYNVPFHAFPRFSHPCSQATKTCKYTHAERSKISECVPRLEQ